MGAVARILWILKRGLAILVAVTIVLMVLHLLEATSYSYWDWVHADIIKTGSVSFDFDDIFDFAWDWGVRIVKWCVLFWIILMLPHWYARFGRQAVVKCVRHIRDIVDEAKE